MAVEPIEEDEWIIPAESDTVEHMSRQQKERAQEARDLYAILGHPGNHALCKAFDTHQTDISRRQESYSLTRSLHIVQVSENEGTRCQMPMPNQL